MRRQAPPFHPNTPDDLQCVQAAIWSLTEHLLPDEEWNLTKIQKLTGYKPNSATWPYKYMLKLADRGLQVHQVGSFNLSQFANIGYEYLLQELGSEAADWQRDNTADLEAEQRRALQILENDMYEQRVPTISDIIQFLDGGWFVICVINIKQLNDESGYIGHSVLVYDYSDDELIFHDPGLPPIEARRKSFKAFESAWASPNDQSKTLIAVRS